MRRLTRYLLILHIAVTAGFLAFMTVVWIKPDLRLGDLSVAGPITNLDSLAVSIAMGWLVVTVLLMLAWLRRINSENVVMVAGAFTVAMLYAAFLREHVSFGDFRAYIRAAENIIAGEPFAKRYVYPPLWASFLAHIYRAFGERGAVIACFAVNQLSIVLFYILASLFVSRCRLSLSLSAILVFFALIVNVPLLRNTVYVQVNLLLADLVLASVLVLPWSALLSAGLLALGAHLKVVPILFVPLFLLNRKWRWFGYFAGVLLGLVLLTSLTDGRSYYHDFFSNLKIWAVPALRSSSIYGFLVNTSRYLGVGLPVGMISRTATVALVVLLAYLSGVAVRRRSFAHTGLASLDSIINGIVPLFFLMPAISPVVWIHHLVVLIVPAVLVLGRLENSVQGFLFAMGYCFTFLLPVFDCYPWSYLRLAGWLTLLVLTIRIVSSGRAPDWIRTLDEEVNSTVRSLTQRLVS
jgi:hypothetical protein